METLLDYIFETKRLSYIAAVMLMVGAIPFWRFLTERDEQNGSGAGTQPADRRSS